MSNVRIRGSAGPLVVAALSLGVALAATFALVELLAPGTRDPLAVWNALPADRRPWAVVPTAGPLLVALLALILRPRVVADETEATGQESTSAAVAPAARQAPEEIGSAFGLRLLATLQEEARLLDFVREDVEGYPDDQVGAAVRGIHAALRKAIDERMRLEPILAGDDGDAVEVPVGFDPAAIRLTGSPAGKPPFRGILRHPGWRALDVRLPRPTVDGDPGVLAPAEVEIS